MVVGLVAVVTGITERTSTGDYVQLSSWLPVADLDEKTVHGSKVYCHGGNGWVKPYSTSQSGPEFKYLLQGGMSEKGSLLAKPSQPLGYLIRTETLFWAYVTPGHISFM